MDLKLNTDAPRPPERRISPLKLPTTPPTAVGNVKFKHPLSKNMSILTQAGNELIIDDSDAGYATPSDGNESIDIGNNNNVAADDDKTPTNESAPFDLMTFDGDESCGKRDAAADGEEPSAISAECEEAAAADKCDEKRDSNAPSEEPTKPTPPPTPSTLKNSWTYLHSMFSKAEASPPPNRNSQFYVDEEPTNGQNTVETAADEAPKQNGKPAADAARTRPISSASLSSTSSGSSSSSVSDELSPNQNVISYLASVESLADHSESETLRLGGNSTFTVAERACMEIIDTEASYVDDLGQVISG